MHTESSNRFRPGPTIASAALCVLILGGCATPPSDPAATEIVVRVLPFEVTGQLEGADYLGRALAESLSIRLAQSEELRLLDVPFDSVDPSEPVTRRIEGSLTRDGEVVTARLRLFTPGSTQPIWETEIDSDEGELSKLISRLTMSTVRSMEVSYPDLYQYIGDISGGPEMSRSTLATRSFDAWKRFDTDGFVEASTELVAAFPDDPAAHVLNAFALLLSWDAVPSGEATLARLGERLEALERVDPTSPYDEMMRAYVYRSSGQPEQARSLYSRVLARRDLASSARAWALRQRCYTYQQAGDAAAAADDAEAAVALDPSNASSLAALSRALEALGRLDDAIVRSKQSIALQETAWRHHQRLGLVLYRAKQTEASVLSVRRACELGDSQEACANLAVVLRRDGRETEALSAAKHAEGLEGSRWGYYNLACYRALGGQQSSALVALRRAVDLGFADLLIANDSDLETIRDAPEFAEIVAAVEERLSSRRELSKSVFPWQA